MIEKLKCILNYFKRMLARDTLANVITFQRRQLEPTFKWEDSTKSISRTKFHITSQSKIEDADGMLQADFANRFIGGGVLSRGAVQEEIRFVINCEMIVARLFTECLRDDEALIMIGCEQFNDYAGYASRFQFNGDFDDRTPFDVFRRRKCRVVAIDAIPFNNLFDQFDERNLRRELNKALVGFYNDNAVNDKSPIATGLWGCGAFNGHPIRSALIQLMACRVSHRNIALYTFGDERIKDEIADIFKFLVEKDVKVGQLFNLLVNFQHECLQESNSLTAFIKSQFEHTRS